MADKTYLIEKADGEEFKITIPEEWKVTFGPAFVGSGGMKVQRQYSGKVPMALRVYETKDKQRAIYTNVVSFRDVSIPIVVKKTHTQEKQGFMEYGGKRKATSFRARVQEWVDPDQEINTPAIEAPAGPVDVEEFDVSFDEGE